MDATFIRRRFTDLVDHAAGALSEDAEHIRCDAVGGHLRSAGTPPAELDVAMDLKTPLDSQGALQTSICSRCLDVFLSLGRPDV